MTPKAALLAASALAWVSALGSAALLGPGAASIAAGCGLVGICAGALGATYSLTRASARGASSAVVWFRAVPGLAGWLWVAASWAQALTAAWWSPRPAVGFQLAASTVWALLALLVSAASHHASEEEDTQAADRILREHEDEIEARFARVRIASEPVEATGGVEGHALGTMHSWKNQ